MRKLLRTRSSSLRTASSRPLQPASRRTRTAGGGPVAETAIVSGTALALAGIAVCCQWSPEQLALVLTATAGCTAPALLRTRI
ncbi:hypothetical protein OG196_42925 (plasmid) [Kitasatospora purpeofusca]|uniref:hypothetical protein n=1 Tax=Kitasatospora purpeofusca TaxID=67352 RepID=UPI002E0F1041|nr:hypothetical protein OG196_42925 [Kitasatospora purpeofusca]